MIEKARQNSQAAPAAALRPESTNDISNTDETASVSNSQASPAPASPTYLEYSPSSKPSISPTYNGPCAYDLFNNGLLPVMPLLHPRPSIYPFYDLKTPPLCNYMYFPIKSGL